VDNTTVLQIQHHAATLFLVLLVEGNAQLWENLLHTSGGKLEIPKCLFVLMQWYYNKRGTAQLVTTHNQFLHIWCSKTNKSMIIPQMAPSKAYKYVRVHIALDGNMKEQINNTHTKCIAMGSIFSQCIFRKRL
jgi:hypothetical protein